MVDHNLESGCDDEQYLSMLFEHSHVIPPPLSCDSHVTDPVNHLYNTTDPQISLNYTLYYYPMQVVLHSWLGHRHWRGNHHQTRVSEELDMSQINGSCLSIFEVIISTVHTADTTDVVMDIVFLYVELYNFLLCRDEIYIAPSRVQKERIKVIF